jgi:hypothetical protein
MSTFSYTAIVDYRLSFTTNGNKLPISFSVCSKQTEVRRFLVFRLEQTDGVAVFH